MEISAQVVWWIVVGLLVGVELITGTFYLLAIATGLAAGALTGASLAVQLVVAAVVSIAGTAAAHYFHLRKQRELPKTQSNPDVHPDIGQLVTLPHEWQAGVNESRIAYRGSTWSAESSDGRALSPGQFRIAALKGSTLVLSRVAPD